MLGGKGKWEKKGWNEVEGNANGIGLRVDCDYGAWLIFVSYFVGCLL